MGDLTKYLLVIAVIGTGFYTAQQYRRPQPCPSCDALASREGTAQSVGADSQRSSGVNTTESLPVAALTDVDRVPLLGPDRAAAAGKSPETGADSVTKQPTLRADKPVAGSTATEPGKRPAADVAGRDDRKAEASKPSPKKQEKKKATAAKSDAAEQQRAGAGEKAQSDTKTAEPRNTTRQESTPAKTGATEWAQNDDAVPPEFARQYEPYFKAAEGRPDRTPAPQAKPKPRADKRPPAANEPQTTCRQPDGVAPRRHRIVEGDTLKQLAEKYLGSRERYLDIFQANSDVLFDPRLIPIGVEILIPERTTAVAQAVGGPAPAAAAAAEQDDASEHGEVWNDFFSVPPTSNH